MTGQLPPTRDLLHIHLRTLFVLDAGMLSLLTNPTASAAALECHRWTRDLLRQGGRFAIPEIADYEVRRELLRTDRMRALRALDELKAVMFYLPLSTDALLRASEIWAAAKKFGRADLGVGVREGALDSLDDDARAAAGLPAPGVALTGGGDIRAAISAAAGTC